MTPKVAGPSSLSPLCIHVGSQQPVQAQGRLTAAHNSPRPPYAPIPLPPVKPGTVLSTAWSRELAILPGSHFSEITPVPFPGPEGKADNDCMSNGQSV